MYICVYLLMLIIMIKRILMFLLLETYTFFIYSQNHKNVCDNMHTYTHVT